MAEKYMKDSMINMALIHALHIDDRPLIHEICDKLLGIAMDTNHRELLDLLDNLKEILPRYPLMILLARYCEMLEIWINGKDSSAAIAFYFTILEDRLLSPTHYIALLLYSNTMMQLRKEAFSVEYLFKLLHHLHRCFQDGLFSNKNSELIHLRDKVLKLLASALVKEEKKG